MEAGRKDLNALKKEKKRRKQEKLLRQLEKDRLSEAVASSAKPVPKNIVKELLAGEGRGGRSYTVSVALPGSILDNAQSPELRTYLAGQVRAVCFQSSCSGGQKLWDVSYRGRFRNFPV